ncbi:AP-4 complex accessory subunit RUSC2 isoform X2 [Eucyclogobius newberryi]|uniref:AP-4 complex accessory subunit RUSC2 isoform X2 n=1 Tax=Eucyclogobius newberryi TaxID=166745 RepID=UPI003B5AD2D6
MIGASSQSGDTLIACHFPVVQLPSWQIPVCSSAKRSSRLCTAGLTRAVSLPERDSLNREHVFNGVRRHFSSSYSSLTEERTEEEGTSDSSGRYEPSSSPEDSSSHIRRPHCQGKACVRSHNSFLPSSEMDEDEEDEDSDGDNLHRYCEDSSFVLHGNTNWPGWGNEGTIVGSEFDQEWISDQPNQMDNLRDKCQCYHNGDASISLMANVPQSSNRLMNSMSCCIHSLQKCSPENSDSSCNSSDGILVNFCTMYNRSNNPASPAALSSPTLDSSKGSVFLNLHPVPHSPQQELRAEAEHSPHALDSNCNRYCVEPLSAGLSSLEASDLNACLQNQAMLQMGTNQKYYKLVSCDLSSQSPSPALSTSTCCPVGQSKSSSPSGEHLQQNDHKKGRVDQHTERCFSTAEFPVASTSTATDWRKHLLHTSCLLSSSQSSPQGSKCQGTSTETTQPSGLLDHDYNDEQATDRQIPVVRFTKAQRPTSLPIRPFVLVPTKKPPPQSELLGGLLEQYIHQKNNRGVSSQPSFTFKGKRSQCFTNMQLSPMGSQCPIFLEAPSSSDTCSTCTPSPDCFRHIWSRSGTSPSMLQPNQTSPYSDRDVVLAHSRATLVKIPTYRNLIHLTPEQQDNQLNKSKCSSSNSSEYTMTPPTVPPTDDTNSPNQVAVTPPSPVSGKNKLSHYYTAPAPGFMRSTLTAAVSSAAPLSSLLRSWTSHRSNPLHLQDSAGANGKHTQASEGPSVEFGLSPDPAYESMSISHLQRRGLLRAVSRAVDLIMAHFGCSREPEEKLRLGDSSRSPTIAGLVLEHLCPSIQNILEDGLRDHKLDPIIGQRPTHSWRIVEVSTRLGPSTKVLNCLVLKIKQYPQLTDHCMRLRAFIMGLLNLRSLEFWLSHLNNLKDVVATHYHSWGFLSMSLGRCEPLFQELLLLLQPLSVLPFDLNLLLEPRLLHNRLLCTDDQRASPPAPSSGLLATSWPLLQADSNPQMNTSHQVHVQSRPRPPQPETQASSSLFSAPATEWWLRESGTIDGEDCSPDGADHWSQISMESRQEEQRNTPVLNESQCEGGLRWAKLFGSADLSTSAVTVSGNPIKQRRRFNKRPSEWLHLDRSQLGVLAQSLMSMKL